MTGPRGLPVITRQDVEAAQAVIDDWTDEYAISVWKVSGTELAYLRGLITQAICDAHAKGYDEGVARGRRLVANAVRDALDGEGLL